MYHGPERPNTSKLELEALHRLNGARILMDAILTGHWRPEPYVLEHIALLVRQAERWYEVSGWAA